MENQVLGTLTRIFTAEGSMDASMDSGTRVLPRKRAPRFALLSQPGRPDHTNKGNVENYTRVTRCVTMLTASEWACPKWRLKLNGCRVVPYWGANCNLFCRSK